MAESMGQKMPFTKRQVQSLKRLLLAEGNLRDFCLFAVGLDTMLRSSDLRALTVLDVKGPHGIKGSFYVKQAKTSKTTRVLLQGDTQKALAEWINQSGKQAGEFLFTSRWDSQKALGYVQHTKLVKKWAKWLSLDPALYSTHSIRRTKATLIYKETHNIEVCRQLLGHSNLAATSRYLGVQEAESMEIAAKMVL